ncbi:ZIP family metal transporter [Candidatus Kaiserbacteria bacterium]|nr:ZIP family metal transporter [Candidatus Kaiserbacteria bacterium]
MVYILLACALVMLASFVGVLSVWKHLGEHIERNLSMLVSFSAGVFLLIGYELARETLEHAPSAGYGLAWIIGGIVLLSLIFRLIPAFHHHHDEHEETHPHPRIDGRRVLLSDGIHNIGDGILLSAAFAVSTPFGWVTVASVLVHELVQEISEFFVLRQAGYDTKRAITLNVLVSATILIGAIGSFFLLDLFTQLKLPLLGLTAGALFVVFVYDLIPHSVRASQKETRWLRHIFWFALGAFLMFGVQTLASHSKESDKNEQARLEPARFIALHINSGAPWSGRFQ